MPIGRADLEPGPMVAPDAGARSAIEAMDRYHTDWAGVLDGDRLAGWVGRSDLDGVESVAEAELRPFERTVDCTDSLRTALDIVVRSHERVAVVLEEGEYLGILDLESIAREITE